MTYGFASHISQIVPPKNGRINDEKWKIDMIKEMCLSKLGLIESDSDESDTKIMLEIICTE